MFYPQVIPILSSYSKVRLVACELELTDLSSDNLVCTDFICILTMYQILTDEKGFYKITAMLKLLEDNFQLLNLEN